MTAYQDRINARARLREFSQGIAAGNSTDSYNMADVIADIDLIVQHSDRAELAGVAGVGKRPHVVGRIAAKRTDGGVLFIPVGMRETLNADAVQRAGETGLEVVLVDPDTIGDIVTWAQGYMAARGN